METQKIKFSWDIHYKCNFRCPYCWFYKEWAKMSKRNVYLSPDEWMVHWNRIYDKYGEVKIEIVGGEPSIYPNFIELIKKLSSIHLVKITTNLSGDVERFVKEISPDRVNLDLNYHVFFIDLETVIRKARILNDAGFKSGICFLAYPPQMNQIDRLSKVFQEAGIGFALAAFWGEHEGKKYPEAYTAEEREMIRPYLGDVDRFLYHLNAKSPRGKLCNAGYKYASIQGDGKVVRCGPLADKFIGNILNKDFQLFKEPILCESDTCPCNEYICLLDDKEVEKNLKIDSCDAGINSKTEENIVAPNVFLSNKELNQREILERKIILDSKPLRLGIVVTNWCNLDCIMCISARHSGEHTISSTALSKINVLLPYLEIIEWQGGEFFNFKFMKDMFHLFREYPNITHCITTNGLLLDQEWIQLLLELNATLIFSIDSPLKETYEYIRKNGDYNKLLENIELIIELEHKYKKRINRSISVVVMKSNYHLLNEFIPFVKKYGFQNINFTPVMCVENEENIFKDQNLDIEYFDKIANYMKDKFSEISVGFSWHLPSKCNKQSILSKVDNAKLYCNLPWKKLWIAADRNGDIFLDCWCVNPIGNIYQDDLLEAWNNNNIQEYRKKIVMGNLSLCNPDCVNNYRDYCKS